MNWKVVATAPDQMTAEMLLDLLKAQGISGQMHPGDVTGFLGVSPHSVRVMVGEQDVDAAREFIESLGEPGPQIYRER